MKKLLASILSLALSVSLLSACSKPATNDPTGSSSGGSTSSTKAEKTVVTLWSMYAEDAEPTSPHQRIVKWAEKFNSTNKDNIEVKVAGGKKADVILTTIASGATPDIFQGYWNNAPTWANNGALYDLTNYVNNDKEWNKADFMDASWNVSTYNGKIYSIPCTFSSTFMFYNKDMLASAGWKEFPKSMDELAKCIRDLTKTDSKGNITQMGLIPDYPWLDNVLWPVAFGAEYIKDGKITFDSPEMMKAYQFQADIYKEYGFDKIKRFVDTLGARATNEDPLFKGKLAMRWNADSALASMVKSAKETKTNMGIAVMPPVKAGDKSKNMLTCSVWQVNSKTKNPDATWKALSSLTSAENMAFMAEGDFNNGTFLPRKSALEAVMKMNVSDEAKLVAQLLRDTQMVSFPMCSYINQYLNEIGTQMNDALAGKITVEQAAKNVVTAIQPLADKEKAK